MEQRVSLITLGVAGLNRARQFYTSLGWRPATSTLLEDGSVSLPA